MNRTKKWARKRRGAVSQKKIDQALERLEKVIRRLSANVRASERITGEDLRITVY